MQPEPARPCRECAFDACSDAFAVGRDRVDVQMGQPIDRVGIDHAVGERLHEIPIAEDRGIGRRDRGTVAGVDPWLRSQAQRHGHRHVRRFSRGRGDAVVEIEVAVEVGETHTPEGIARARERPGEFRTTAARQERLLVAFDRRPHRGADGRGRGQHVGGRDDPGLRVAAFATDAHVQVIEVARADRRREAQGTERRRRQFRSARPAHRVGRDTDERPRRHRLDPTVRDRGRYARVRSPFGSWNGSTCTVAGTSRSPTCTDQPSASSSPCTQARPTEPPPSVGATPADVR